MDLTEAQAEQFLLHLGLGPVVYEPDGNRPPDFLTENGTAIEVRRLNQHFHNPRGSVALEHDTFPILHGIQTLLTSFEKPRQRQSWWIGYRYRRPIPRWRELLPLVRDALSRVAESSDGAGTIRLHPSFDLIVAPCKTGRPETFVLSGFIDHDAGGWLLNELRQNIELCVEEKRRKVAPFRQKYPRWWLVLIDHIGFGGSALEQELFARNVRVAHDWDRVLLVSPRDPRRWIEVQQPEPA